MPHAQWKIIHPKRENTPKNAAMVITVSVFISRSIIGLIIPLGLMRSRTKAIKTHCIVVQVN
jgi:hypothetical protein